MAFGLVEPVLDAVDVGEVDVVNVEPTVDDAVVVIDVPTVDDNVVDWVVVTVLDGDEKRHPAMRSSRLAAIARFNA